MGDVLDSREILTIDPTKTKGQNKHKPNFVPHLNAKEDSRCNRVCKKCFFGIKTLIPIDLNMSKPGL